jgi:hypothetical protein
MPLRARILPGVSDGCHQMRMYTTMTRMAVVYRRPGRRCAAERQAAAGQLGPGRASQPGEVGWLPAHVGAVAGPVLAAASGWVVAELIVGFSDEVSLIDAAIFGRKIRGPSSLAVGPAQPDAAEAAPQFSTRMTGSYERKDWKRELYDRLAVQATTIDPGPAGMKIAVPTGPGRNWANLWKLLIDAFGPVLGEDPHPAVPSAR